MKALRLAGAVSLGLVCAAPALLRADTLILRDGRRIDGDLVAVRDGTIEFDSRRGFGHERMRIDRADVRAIELSDYDRDREGRDRDDRDRDDRGGRPSGMREREIIVDASAPWTDTRIEVRSGQTVYFEASGHVRWGPKREDGPEGEHDSPRNDRRPIPNRPAAALIGRIGDSNDLFFIGDDKGAIRVRSSGRLYLGINDDYLKDNSGSFRVTVYY